MGNGLDFNFAQSRNVKFMVAVADGKIDGVTLLDKFGYNADISTATETVWDEGGVYAYLTTSATLTISSSSANDTSAGTGARTCTIYGCDGDCLEQSETLTLNGQSAVNTANTYLRIWRIIVNTAGSGGTNAGNIYVGTGSLTAGKPATVYGKVGIGNGQSLMALWTVPANKKFIMTRARLNHGRSSNSYATIDVFVRPLGGVFNLKTRFDASQGQVEWNGALAVDAKSDIEIRAIASTSGTAVAGQFLGYILDVT